MLLDFNFKTKAINGFLETIDTKIQQFNNEVKKLRDGLQNESKSSAGDKHETGRAMMHLEIENKGGQLAMLRKQNFELNGIGKKQCDRIEKGAMVKTNIGVFLISTSLGEIKIASTSVYAVSIDSPIFLALRNKQIGESLDFNGRLVEIQSII